MQLQLTNTQTKLQNNYMLKIDINEQYFNAQEKLCDKAKFNHKFNHK